MVGFDRHEEISTAIRYFVELLCIVEKQLNVVDKWVQRSVFIRPKFLLNANEINRLFDNAVVVGVGSMPMEMKKRKRSSQVLLCNKEASYRLLGNRMKVSQTIRSSSDLYARKASYSSWQTPFYGEDRECRLWRKTNKACLPSLGLLSLFEFVWLHSEKWRIPHHRRDRWRCEGALASRKTKTKRRSLDSLCDRLVWMPRTVQM